MAAKGRNRILLGGAALLAVAFVACIPNQNEDNLYREQLLLARAAVTGWSLRCDGAAAKEDMNKPFCQEDDFQGDFDSLLWNGLLCASGGEVWACQAVRDSQSADGRVWRSPRLRHIENGDIDRPSFSRDMALGGLVYLVHSRDVVFGDAWSRYIEAQGGLCPDTSDTCWVGPQLYWLFNQVAEHVGFRKLPPLTAAFYRGNNRSLREDFSERLFADRSLLLQALALSGAAGVAHGFEFHLVGTHLYLLKRMGRWSELNQQTAEVLSNAQPRNPFYRFLAGESVNSLAPEVLAMIPPFQPRVRYLWTLEKKDTEVHPLVVYDQSMGWEFVFMINLLLAPEAVAVEEPRPEETLLDIVTFGFFPF